MVLLMKGVAEEDYENTCCKIRAIYCYILFAVPPQQTAACSKWWTTWFR